MKYLIKYSQAKLNWIEDLRQKRTPVSYDINSFQYDVNKDNERLEQTIKDNN